MVEPYFEPIFGFKDAFIMAKLEIKKEKYGVAVAARIDTQLANRIATKAEQLGISFAQMVGLLIAKGFAPEEPVFVDNSAELEELEITYKTAIAKFLKQISNDEEQHREYISIFRSIRDEDSTTTH